MVNDTHTRRRRRSDRLVEVDVVGPLLLNAGRLPVVLTTDYSDRLVQVDVVGPLLLNAGRLPVLTTDYSDRLVEVTD